MCDMVVVATEGVEVRRRHQINNSNPHNKKNYYLLLVFIDCFHFRLGIKTIALTLRIVNYYWLCLHFRLGIVNIYNFDCFIAPYISNCKGKKSFLAVVEE